MFFSASVYCQQHNRSSADQLDADFILLSSAVYSALNKISLPIVTSINQLEEKLFLLQAENDTVAAVQLIISNSALIKENIDHKSIFSFVTILLKNNEYTSAKSILEYAIKYSDKSLASNLKFFFAKYHYNKGEYTKALAMLNNIIPDLSTRNSHYALVMKGVILQKLKKHRKSIKYYDSVPDTSKYYSYAQLNKAVAYIRQGWWSDADIIINRLLSDKKHKKQLDKEIAERLLLVAGYSFLQQEYYRESREAFRNISINSIYANRALLGIAISAASQGDNTGALNILNILQNKKTNNLPVDETYLLLPYIYERIGQYKTSSASYKLGLEYYRKRISELNKILAELKREDYDFSRNNLSYTTSSYVHTPNKEKTQYLIQKLNTLKSFEIKTKNLPVGKKVTALLQKHKTLLKEVVSGKIKTHIAFLESYQSQSNFGIARLYDNSRSTEK